MEGIWKRVWLAYFCMDPEIHQLYLKVFYPYQWRFVIYNSCFINNWTPCTTLLPCRCRLGVKNGKGFFFIPTEDIWGSRVRKRGAKSQLQLSKIYASNIVCVIKSLQISPSKISIRMRHQSWFKFVPWYSSVWNRQERNWEPVCVLQMCLSHIWPTNWKAKVQWHCKVPEKRSVENLVYLATTSTCAIHHICLKICQNDWEN